MDDNWDAWADEAKAIIREKDAEIRRLREAIRRHRDECLSDDIGEPTEYHGIAVYTHTVKLWDVLDTQEPS